LVVFFVLIGYYSIGSTIFDRLMSQWWLIGEQPTFLSHLMLCLKGAGGCHAFSNQCHTMESRFCQSAKYGDRQSMERHEHPLVLS
jgi:hypothetical protein